MMIVLECTESGLPVLNSFIARREGEEYVVSINDKLKNMHIKLLSINGISSPEGIMMSQYTFILDGGKDFVICKAKLSVENKKPLGKHIGRTGAVQYLEDAVQRLKTVVCTVTSEIETLNTVNPFEMSSKNLNLRQINWLLNQLLTLCPSKKYLIMAIIIQSLSYKGMVCPDNEEIIRARYFM